MKSTHSNLNRVSLTQFSALPEYTGFSDLNKAVTFQPSPLLSVGRTDGKGEFFVCKGCLTRVGCR
ncbi:MAG: hypothetical protein LH614_03855, partial [Pyrinomonadaceae bacterium]|nr:hypothetical protein [Pyrinomonadaceae bacterium]